MKNPLVKDDNSSLLIVAAVAGVLTAAVGIWFYHRGKRAAELASDQLNHAQDYLEKRHKRKKKLKTGINELEEIAHHQ